MSILSLQQLFTGEIFPAICRTLAHSLWEGMLLAVTAAVILLLTRRSAAAIRYNLLAAAYLLFIVAIAITFYLQFEHVTSNALSVTSLTVSNEGKYILSSIDPQLNTTPTIGAIILNFIDRNSNSIMLIWCCFIFFKGSRFANGVYAVHKMKTNHVSDADEFCIMKLEMLAAKLQIKRKVRLLQSGIATTPVMLGFLKPIILFPAGLLTALPPEEVEVVLLHELAHVMRRDYLMNLLQQLTEVFLFFNPAVLWVSALIKTERENCCDDIALSATNYDKVNYINALVAFQEFHLSASQYAPALLGRKKHLLTRVRRIINNNNKTLNAMEKLLLTSGLAIAGCLVLAFSGEQSKHVVRSEQPVSQTQPMPFSVKELRVDKKDTVPESLNKLSLRGMNNINTKMNGKRYEIQLKDGAVTGLSIDGQKIDDDKLAEHKAETDAVIDRAMENIAKEKGEAEKALVEADISKTDAALSKQLAEKMLALSDQSKLNEKLAAQLESHLGELKLKAAALDDQKLKETLSELKAQLKANDDMGLKQMAALEKLNGDHLKLKENLDDVLAEKMKALNTLELKKSLENASLELKLAQEQLSKSKIDAELSQQRAKELMAQAKASMKVDKERQLDAQKTSEAIISDLQRDNLVSDKNHLSFSLNKDRLIVNGITQSEAVFRKFKEKYVKDENWSFDYNR